MMVYDIFILANRVWSELDEGFGTSVVVEWYLVVEIGDGVIMKGRVVEVF